MSTNINSTEQIVEINAGDQITNINLVSQSTTQVVSGEQVVTVDVNAGTIPAAWGSITGTLSNQTDLQNALNAKQNNITLTTTGTTGVATLVGATLNIPNYVTSTKQTEWDSAYNDKITSAEVSGTTTKTLTLNQQDGGTITASWSDFDTAPVTSVFGRTGDIVATEGDYNIGQMGDVTITSASNGQVLKYNGTAWVNAADASGLTSVGLAMPSAFAVSGSPLTSNGTITVTGAGTTSQYVRGDGSLAAFPSVSNEAKTLIREVYNSTGATLTKGTVVYINGGQGNLPTVTKALAVGDVTSAQTFGIVQSDITNNNNGFVVVAGGIDNIDTQAFTEGTAIYLSPTTAGAWTSTKPYAPEHIVYLGVIVRSHPTQGVIEVKIQNGYELDELHNVSARFPSNKDGIFYNSTTSVWENKSIAGVLGYTPVPETRIITINGTAQNLSADRTYNVGTVTNVAASGGTGISIGGSPVTGSGTITITNTAPDQVVSLTGAGTTTTSGTYPNFTITSNDQYVGTVTSVNATVPTGFEVSGVPITSSGTVDIKFAAGYSLPTNAKQSEWDTAYTKRLDSLTVTGSSGSATLTSNVLNVPTYTLSGLGGEPAITAGTTLQYFRGDKTFQTLNTSVVPENGAIYFTEPRVRATVLSGMNITGGAITASDNILNAFGKVQNQINGLIGGSIFQSTWNASTNVPALASGVGTKGYYYIVSTAGTTNLDGITDWQIGDWAIFDGTVWRKVDNTDAVVSVNGYTGIVSLVLDDLADVSAASPTDTQLLRFNGTTSKWYNWTPTFEPALTKGNLTEATSSVLTITGGSNAVIGSGTTIQVKQSSATGSGFLSSTDWTTFNNKQNALTNPITGDGTEAAGNIAYFTGNTSIAGESNLFWDSANDRLGVNIAPLTTIHTYKASNNHVIIESGGGSYAYLQLTVPTNSHGYIIKNIATANDVSDKSLYLWNEDGVVELVPSADATKRLTVGTTGALTVRGSITGTISALATAGSNFLTSDSGTIKSRTAAEVRSDIGAAAALSGTIDTIAYWDSTSSIASLALATYPSLTELSYVKGVTSAIQTQIDGKLSLSGGALTGAITSTSSAKFMADAAGIALLLDCAASTDENDLRFYKAGVPYGAIQTSGSTGNFEFYVNTDGTSGGYVKMININKDATGTVFTGNISAGNLSGTNTGDQTLSGLGGVPTSRTLTINGTAYDLSANRTWSVGTVTGSGTASKIAKYTATGTAIGDSIITATDDVVTVTSTILSPMFILNNVTANGYSQLKFEGDVKHAYIFKGNSTYTGYGGANALNFYTDSGGGGFAFYPQTTLGVFMDENGNLGVGAGTSLGAKLDVAGGVSRFTYNVAGGHTVNIRNNNVGTSSYAGLMLGNDIADNAGGIAILSSGHTTGTVYTGNGVYVYSNRSGGLTLSAEGSNSIKFATSTSIKATLDSSGRLGINTTSPTNILHLAGDVATPSLRLGSTTVGYHYDIGRENLTTGDFIINSTKNSVSQGTLFRIDEDNFSITTAGTINAKNTSTLASLSATAVIGVGEFMTTGGSAGYFWENRSGGVTSNSNWYGWYTSAGIVRLYNGASDILQITGSNGNTRIYGSLGIGRDALGALDVYAGTTGALTYMQNTNAAGYSGIDIFRSNGDHVGSVWCANSSAGATNNRNALTLAARATGEKVIIVGGGYDPTVTGGLEVQGGTSKLIGTNSAYQYILSTGGLYSYIWFKAQGGTADQDSYLVQNKNNGTSNGVTAGALYFYLSNSQNFEFSWAGTSKVTIDSTGKITAGSFFESSDMRLKTLINKEIDYNAVMNIKPKYYLKDNKEELGYFAQEFNGIFDSAITKNHKGYLDLSYRQIHTAKIAALENKIKELEEKLNLK